MKSIIKIKSLLFLIIFIQVCLHYLYSSQDIYSAIPAPQSDALADSGTASILGVQALTINPANLIDNNDYRLDAYYSHSFHILNVGFDFLAFKYSYRPNIAFGLGFAFFNSGEMIRAPEGSIREDKEGYYTTLLGSETFDLRDNIIITSAAYETPWNFSSGLSVKFDFSKADKYKAYSIFIDGGITYYLFQQFDFNAIIYPYIVPQRVSAVIKDYGYAKAYLEDNKAGQFMHDIRGSLFFDPALVKSKYYDLWYTLEFSKSADFIMGLSHEVILPFADITVMHGFNIKKDSGSRFSSGLTFKTPIFKFPMETGYSFQVFKRSLYTHNFYYTFSWDTLSKNVQINMTMNKIQKLINEEKYSKALRFARMQQKKFPDSDIVNIVERLDDMNWNEKESFFMR